MKTLFIDTNVYLSFYHLTNEDIEELKKLVALIDSDQISLISTEQVKHEFQRNRGGKIADAMKRLQDAKFNLSFPAFAKDYAEYTELRELLKSADKKHAELVTKVTTDARNGALKADELVSDLISKSTLLKTTEDLYLDALTRVRLGNPPGKEGSLGDAINWGCLLKEIPEGEDLHLVSEDKDYRSQLSVDSFSEFLDSEWTEKKKSTLYYYARLSDFFKKNFPNIKIASEVERDLLVEELTNSGSFASTHFIISKLAKQTDFSPAQIEALVNIAQSNNQVGWIIGDSDVYDFYSSLSKKHCEKLQPDTKAQLLALLDEGKPDRTENDSSKQAQFGRVEQT